MELVHRLAVSVVKKPRRLGNRPHRHQAGSAGIPADFAAGFLAWRLLNGTQQPMPTTSAIESVLNRIRPMLQADGGDIELVERAGPLVRVRLTGVCAGCPTSHMTLHLGVESALRRLHPSLRVDLIA
jgi:Fe-S cluster biogenesis protein NfuA